MIIKPYSPDRTRRIAPVALCDDTGEAFDQWGRVIGDHHPHAVYIDRDTARVLITSGQGSGIFWRDRLIEWEPPGDRHPVRVLPADHQPQSWSDAYTGLVGWQKWLEGYGVSLAPPGKERAPASVGSASMRLLRASLAETLYTSAPRSALPPIHGVIGGRQECLPPGTYTGNFHLWDMRAAYASTLADTPYGGWWRRLGMDGARKVNWPGVVRSGTPAFLNAEVRFGPLVDIGPLPKRPRGRRDYVESSLLPTDYPTDGRLFGTWTAAEVMAAKRAGCAVRIIDGWKMFVDSTHKPFAQWWDRIKDGREMIGYAGTLAKITGNSLIGQFHIDTRAPKRRVRWEGGRKVSRHVPHRGGVQPAFDIAEHVTGTVRARLYDGALWPLHGRMIASHTDSVWVRGDDPPRGPGWRHDDAAEVIDLIDSQHLAYRDPSGVTKYIMAGFAPEHAPTAMDELWTAQFGQGSPQRRTKAFDHITETERVYAEQRGEL